MRYRPELIHQTLRRRYFERLVDRSVRSLPPSIKNQLDNVEIVIVDEPIGDQDVFGLYEGIPKTERTSDYGYVVPDRISIYRGPLERAFPNPPDLAHQVRITVLHEVAHHFGMDEDQLERYGYQ